MERNYPEIVISNEGVTWLDKGQMWMYKNNLEQCDPNIKNGELVDIVTRDGRYLGTGFISLESHITVRILSKNQNEIIDRQFFQNRIQQAYDFRKTVEGDNLSNCRLIFGEADLLPGLVIDRYNDILVSQISSYGLEQIKDMIYEIVLDVLKADGEDVKGIYERNDIQIRTKEGLEQYKGYYKNKDLPTQTIINENGLLLHVDVENGQKTGFFLDQKYNRQAVAKIAKGRKVLDCFTHTGSFALNAAKGGAASVTAVDISAEAVRMAEHNAAINGLAKGFKGLQANVFDLLSELVNNKSHEYDFIILDPPAFTKSGSTVKNAVRGYKEINLKAMKLLPRGGYLATCSCSHFMKEELFVQMLHDAAKDACVSLRQIEVRQQAPDHPVLWNVPETFYLKFYIFQVV